MEKPDTLDLNLRQLDLLVTIHRAGSLSAAARVLGMNQSTVSYHLEQMRQRFGDPLFVRVAQGMQPTERMEQILGPARSVLHEVRAMGEPLGYDAADDDGVLRIACGALERDLLLGPLIRQASDLAPHLTFEISAPGSAWQVAGKLKAADLDLALYPDRLGNVESLYQSALVPLRDAVFFDPAHPLAPGDAEAYCSRPHARIALGPDASFSLDARLAKHGLTRKVGLQAADFDALAALVEGTRLIATLPRHMRHCSFCRLDWIDAPFPNDPLTMTMFWHARQHGSPRLRFWRDKITAIARQIPD